MGKDWCMWLCTMQLGAHSGAQAADHKPFCHLYGMPLRPPVCNGVKASLSNPPSHP